MKNVTHSFVFLAHWPSAGSFGLNTDILATNLINLTVVVGVSISFWISICVITSELEPESIFLLCVITSELESDSIFLFEPFFLFFCI